MASHRRGRHGPSHRTLLATGVVLGLCVGGGLVAAAAVPLAKGPPTLVVVIPGTQPAAPALVPPFPKTGESAVAVPSLDWSAAGPVQTPVPIESLTKLMTAYVALAALPLAPDATGPTIEVTHDDVVEYRMDQRTDQSSVKVAQGEVLTERQLLDGLLVHSANNYASLLSRMVAGSDTEMVVRMNATAHSLGMRATTYVDVSGFDPGSQSNAVDVLHLATLLMRNPTFAQIVAQTSVVLPVAGEVGTFTPYLGKPGVVGIKSGLLTEYGGSDALAFDAKRGSDVVQVISVVLDQHSAISDHLNLKAAGRAALVLASATSHHLTIWHVTTRYAAAGVLGWPASGVPVVANDTIVVPVLAGLPAHATITPLTWGSSEVNARKTVAVIVVASGTWHATTHLYTVAALTRPTLWQRLR